MSTIERCDVTVEAMNPMERSEFFNAHRYVTPGHQGWERVATPGAPNKYLMISADCHVNEPPNLWVERIEEKYRHRLPRIEVDQDGVKWSIVEGYHPVKIRDLKMEGEDQDLEGQGQAPGVGGGAEAGHTLGGGGAGRRVAPLGPLLGE